MSARGSIFHMVWCAGLVRFCWFSSVLCSWSGGDFSFAAVLPQGTRGPQHDFPKNVLLEASSTHFAKSDAANPGSFPRQQVPREIGRRCWSKKDPGSFPRHLRRAEDVFREMGRRGWKLRSVNGSHNVFTRAQRQIVIPAHGQGELPPHVLRHIAVALRRAKEAEYKIDARLLGAGTRAGTKSNSHDTDSPSAPHPKPKTGNKTLTMRTPKTASTPALVGPLQPGDECEGLFGEKQKEVQTAKAWAEERVGNDLEFVMFLLSEGRYRVAAYFLVTELGAWHSEKENYGAPNALMKVGLPSTSGEVDADTRLTPLTDIGRSATASTDGIVGTGGGRATTAPPPTTQPQPKRNKKRGAERNDHNTGGKINKAAIFKQNFKSKQTLLQVTEVQRTTRDLLLMEAYRLEAEQLAFVLQNPGTFFRMVRDTGTTGSSTSENIWSAVDAVLGEASVPADVLEEEIRGLRKDFDQSCRDAELDETVHRLLVQVEEEESNVLSDDDDSDGSGILARRGGCAEEQLETERVRDDTNAVLGPYLLKKEHSLISPDENCAFIRQGKLSRLQVQSVVRRALECAKSVSADTTAAARHLIDDLYDTSEAYESKPQHQLQLPAPCYGKIPVRKENVLAYLRQGEVVANTYLFGFAVSTTGAPKSSTTARLPRDELRGFGAERSAAEEDHEDAARGMLEASYNALRNKGRGERALISGVWLSTAFAEKLALRVECLVGALLRRLAAFQNWRIQGEAKVVLGPGGGGGAAGSFRGAPAGVAAGGSSGVSSGASRGPPSTRERKGVRALADPVEDEQAEADEEADEQSQMRMFLTQHAGPMLTQEQEDHGMQTDGGKKSKRTTNKTTVRADRNEQVDRGHAPVDHTGSDQPTTSTSAITVPLHALATFFVSDVLRLYLPLLQLGAEGAEFLQDKSSELEDGIFVSGAARDHMDAAGTTNAGLHKAEIGRFVDPERQAKGKCAEASSAALAWIDRRVGFVTDGLMRPGSAVDHAAPDSCCTCSLRAVFRDRGTLEAVLQRAFKGFQGTAGTSTVKPAKQNRQHPFWEAMATLQQVSSLTFSKQLHENAKIEQTLRSWDLRISQRVQELVDNHAEYEKALDAAPPTATTATDDLFWQRKMIRDARQDRDAGVREVIKSRGPVLAQLWEEELSEAFARVERWERFAREFLLRKEPLRSIDPAHDFRLGIARNRVLSDCATTAEKQLVADFEAGKIFHPRFKYGDFSLLAAGSLKNFFHANFNSRNVPIFGGEELGAVSMRPLVATLVDFVGWGSSSTSLEEEILFTSKNPTAAEEDEDEQREIKAAGGGQTQTTQTSLHQVQTPQTSGGVLSVAYRHRKSLHHWTGVWAGVLPGLSAMARIGDELLAAVTGNFGVSNDPSLLPELRKVSAVVLHGALMADELLATFMHKANLLEVGGGGAEVAAQHGRFDFLSMNRLSFMQILQPVLYGTLRNSVHNLATNDHYLAPDGGTAKQQTKDLPIALEQVLGFAARAREAMRWREDPNSRGWFFWALVLERFPGQDETLRTKFLNLLLCEDGATYLSNADLVQEAGNVAFDTAFGLGDEQFSSLAASVAAALPQSDRFGEKRGTPGSPGRRGVDEDDVDGAPPCPPPPGWDEAAALERLRERLQDMALSEKEAKSLVWMGKTSNWSTEFEPRFALIFHTAEAKKRAHASWRQFLEARVKTRVCYGRLDANGVNAEFDPPRPVRKSPTMLARELGVRKQEFEQKGAGYELQAEALAVAQRAMERLQQELESRGSSLLRPGLSFPNFAETVNLAQRLPDFQLAFLVWVQSYLLMFADGAEQVVGEDAIATVSAQTAVGMDGVRQGAVSMERVLLLRKRLQSYLKQERLVNTVMDAKEAGGSWRPSAEVLRRARAALFPPSERTDRHGNRVVVLEVGRRNGNSDGHQQHQQQARATTAVTEIPDSVIIFFRMLRSAAARVPVASGSSGRGGGGCGNGNGALLFQALQAGGALQQGLRAAGNTAAQLLDAAEETVTQLERFGVVLDRSELAWKDDDHVHVDHEHDHAYAGARRAALPKSIVVTGRQKAQQEIWDVSNLSAKLHRQLHALCVFLIDALADKANIHEFAYAVGDPARWRKTPIEMRRYVFDTSDEGRAAKKRLLSSSAGGKNKLGVEDTPGYFYVRWDEMGRQVTWRSDGGGGVGENKGRGRGGGTGGGKGMRCPAQSMLDTVRRAADASLPTKIEVPGGKAGKLEMNFSEKCDPGPWLLCQGGQGVVELNFSETGRTMEY